MLARIKPTPHAPKHKAAPRPATRRRPPDLLQWAGIEAVPRAADVPAFDPVKLALRIWHAGGDPRGSMLVERSGLVLPADVGGEVVRFLPRMTFDNERVPGLVWLLRDVFTSEPAAILRVFLDIDGTRIGERMLGRGAWGAAIKLTPDEHVEQGLHCCVGIDLALAAMAAGYRPIWCFVSADALASFAPLSGVESLTILADDSNSEPVAAVAGRWHEAGAEVNVMPRPP